MALCWLMSRLAARTGSIPEIHAITVDHGLRPEAEDEAAQVGAWMREWPHVTHEVLKRGKGDANMFRIMERARDDRYMLLAAYCEARNIHHLFAAHHQDDQAETFLFRLAKGSGIDGLAGMKPVQDYYGRLKIVRPFLFVPKARLVATCEREHIPFVHDPTNDDARFARTRLRRATAILEKEGLSARRLAVTAKRILRARTALEHYAQKAFGATLKEQAEDGGSGSGFVFDFSALRAETGETRLRVLAMAMEKIHDSDDDNGHGPRMEKLESLAERIFHDEGFNGATLGGCQFTLDHKRNALSVMREGVYNAP
jgi:tRNA(Ile)-lysidine synthase